MKQSPKIFASCRKLETTDWYAKETGRYSGIGGTHIVASGACCQFDGTLEGVFFV